MQEIIVKDLIEALSQLENQDAKVAIEAPFYKAGSSLPYRWPLTDYALNVTGLECEADSDGESILIKTYFENGVVPAHLTESGEQHIMEAVDSLTEKLQQVKSQHLTMRVKTPTGELAIIGVEDESTRKDVDSLLLIAE